MTAWFLAPLLTLACSEDSIVLSGTVGDGPGLDAPSLAGAEVEILDLETNEQVLLGETDDQGTFRFLLPAGLDIVALVRSPQTVTTSFVGTSGFIDLTIDEGTLYGMRPELVQQWRDDFDGCPGASDPVVLLGRMEFANLSGENSGESPIAGGGRAEVLAGNDSLPACYLGSESGTYDPLADRTGATGRYAIFGVPRGESSLDVVFEWAPKMFDSFGPVPVYVPRTDEEVVVPYLPLRLELPL